MANVCAAEATNQEVNTVTGTTFGRQPEGVESNSNSGNGSGNEEAVVTFVNRVREVKRNALMGEQ